MVMNRKGQMLILKLMIAIIIFAIVLAMSKPVKDVVVDVTNSTTGLNCTSASVTTENKAACIVTDFLLFYLIGAAISVGMAYIAGRKDINGTVTAIVIFVIVNVLIEPLKTLIVYARDSSHLDCAGTGLSVANKMSCILIDLWLFWLIATVLAAAVTFIFVKKAMSNE